MKHLFIVVQSKFRISTRGNEDEEQLEENYRWWVPISYASSSFNSEFLRTRPEFWIEKAEHSKYVPLRADANDWIIVNVQETGISVFHFISFGTKSVFSVHG